MIPMILSLERGAVSPPAHHPSTDGLTPSNRTKLRPSIIASRHAFSRATATVNTALIVSLSAIGAHAHTHPVTEPAVHQHPTPHPSLSCCFRPIVTFPSCATWAAACANLLTLTTGIHAGGSARPIHRARPPALIQAAQTAAARLRFSRGNWVSAAGGASPSSCCYRTANGEAAFSLRVSERRRGPARAQPAFLCMVASGARSTEELPLLPSALVIQ